MYVYVGMIIEPAANSEATLDKAEKILAKYDHNVEVHEYKSYLDDDEIARMGEYYNSSDRSYLATKAAEWRGESSGGVDEKGIYVSTTRNPDGHFDSWQLFGPGPLTPDIFTTADAYCEAYITDDGVWHASPNTYEYPPEDSSRIMDEWEASLKEVIKASPDKVALIARCHR